MQLSQKSLPMTVPNVHTRSGRMGGGGPQPLVLTGGYDNTLVFWSALEARSIKAIPFPQSQINCLAAASDHRIIIAGGHSCIR